MVDDAPTEVGTSDKIMESVKQTAAAKEEISNTQLKLNRVAEMKKR